MRSTITLTAITLCLLFVACKKDDLPDAPGTRLKKVIVTNEYEVRYQTYRYEDQNRLVSIIDSTDNSEFGYTNFTYNTEGKIIRATIGYTSGGDAFKFLYIYDNNGRIKKRVGVPVMPYLVLDDRVYSYDSLGRLIADTQLYRHGPSIVGYVAYKYDKNNNVVQEEQFSNQFGTIVNNGVGKYTYDNKPNVYSNINQAKYFIADGGPTFLSKNNRTGEGKNEYYSNGLLRKITIQLTPPYSGKIVQEYFYE